MHIERSAPSPVPLGLSFCRPSQNAYPQDELTPQTNRATTPPGRMGAHMRARQLIAGAAFPPDVLKVLFDAFEDAWRELAPHISGDPTVIEAARLSLAEIVLGIARAGPIDRDRIKSAAVDAFRTVHRIGN
jgi:hypothetical protein